ncbi:MAG: response regulator [Spirosomataceae bacterium]
MLPVLTCLLIDDDPDDQEIFLLALQDIKPSVKCRVVNDGFQALDLLQQNQSFVPDYIFIDLNMPRMNGKQCIRELKKIARLEQVPLIIYTTSSSEMDAEETRRLGAAHFMTKPTSIYTLTETLAELFGESRKSCVD